MVKLWPSVKFVTPVALLAGVLMLSGLIGVPAFADDSPTSSQSSNFPSWAEVQAAKQDAAATASQVEKITGLIGQLESRAEELGTAAVSAGSTYAANQRALDEAAARSDVLAGQARRAVDDFARIRSEAGALAAQIYKTGGSVLGVLSTLNDLQQPDSLQQAGLVSVLSHNAASLLARAQAAEKYTASLQKQQQQATEERERLAAQTKKSLDAARAAQQAAENEMSVQQKNSATLRAQLASLTGTAVETETKYQQGVQAQRAYEAVQQAKAAAVARAQADAAKATRELAQREAQNSRGSGAMPPPPRPTSVAPPPPVVVPPVRPPSGGAVNDPAGAKAYASASLGAFGWGQDQFPCLVSLWTRESNWLTTATNPTSGAYGIPQSLPASKMASAGPDWLTNYRTQVNWGLNYIKGRYGSPCAAWAHSQAFGWY